MKSLVRPLLVLSTAATLFACSKTTTTTTGAPEATGALRVSALPTGVTAAMVTVGDSIFHKASCQRCHGMDAKGGERGPNLTDKTWAQISGSYAEIVAIITSGVAKEKVKGNFPFPMRARGGVQPALTDEQVRQVAAYVYTISHR